MSLVLGLYNSLAFLPMGKQVFSRMAGWWTPYSASIRPLVARLEPGFCEVRIKDRRAVRNHLGAVHGGALLNAAELAAGLAIEAARPVGLQWTPRHVTVEYMKKAAGDLQGTARFDVNALEPGDLVVPVKIANQAGDTVLVVKITMNLSNVKSD